MRTKVLVRKLCRDILCLAMQISEEKETDVFVKYFPHEHEFDIEIFPKGFNNDFMDYKLFEIDLTGDNAETKLKEIREDLQAILRCKNAS